MKATKYERHLKKTSGYNGCNVLIIIEIKLRRLFKVNYCIISA